MDKLSIPNCSVHKNQQIIFIKVQKDCDMPVLCARCISENPQSAKLMLVEDILNSTDNTYIHHLPILLDEENSQEQNQLRKVLENLLQLDQVSTTKQINDIFNQIKQNIDFELEVLKKQLLTNILQFDKSELNNFYISLSRIQKLKEILQAKDIKEIQIQIKQQMNSLFANSFEATKELAQKINYINSFRSINNIEDQLKNLSTNFINNCKKIIQDSLIKVENFNNLQSDYNLQLDYNLQNVENIIKFFQTANIISEINQFSFTEQTSNQIKINKQNGKISIATENDKVSKILSNEMIKNDHLYMVEFLIQEHQTLANGHISIGVIPEQKTFLNIYDLKTIKIFAWQRENDCNQILKGNKICQIDQGPKIFRMYICVKKNFIIFTDQSSNSINCHDSDDLFNPQEQYKFGISLYNQQKKQGVEFLSIKSIQI